MKDKKQSKSFLIAINYWLSAGLIVPGIFSTIAIIATSAIISKSNSFVISTAPLIIWSIGAWLGSIYAANYLNKTYVMNNSNKIINFATVYFFLFFFVFNALYQYILIHKIILTINGLLVLVGQMIVFYILGKIYIKNNNI